MAREFIPRQTGAEQLDQVQADVQQAIRAVKDQAPTPDQVTTFVESRAASLNDKVLAFKGPASQTLTLAPACQPEKGRVRQLLVLNFATVALTIAAPIGDTIDGAQSISLGAGKSATIYTDGESKALSIVSFTLADVPASPADGRGWEAYKHIPAGGGLTMWHWAGIATQGVLAATYDFAGAAGTDYAVPFVAPQRGGTLDRLGFDNGTLGTFNVRVAVYNATSDSNFYPSSLIVDSGAISTGGTTGLKSATVSAALTGGKLYWLALNAASGIDIRGIPADQVRPFLGTSTSLARDGYTHLSVTRAHAAFPSTFTAGGALQVGVAPGLGFRLS